jgi:hypothetical protein
MKNRKLAFAMIGMVAALVVFWPLAALAQVTPATPPWILGTPTPFTITVSLLSFVVALGVSIQNTGKLFGQVQVPTNVVLVLTAILPFLTNFVASLQSSGVISAVSLYNAFVTGALTVAANQIPAIVTHAHVTLPRLAKHLATINAAAAAKQPEAPTPTSPPAAAA